MHSKIFSTFTCNYAPSNIQRGTPHLRTALLTLQAKCQFSLSNLK